MVQAVLTGCRRNSSLTAMVREIETGAQPITSDNLAEQVVQAGRKRA
ncbi:MAG: hypothetical protein JXA14_14605 [Anaerolineae bacterium]|nr:hypothetical protein [Anaerolineae bacterium]